MQHIVNLLPLLEHPKNIFITCHTKPDADAIGSTLALYHYLKIKGHNPIVVAPSASPNFLNWMPGVTEILDFQSNESECLSTLKTADLVFCLDFSRLDRVRELEPVLRADQTPKVLIDHHLDAEEDVFEYGICLPEKSSTCEMVYDLIQLLGDAPLINLDIAQCLYTGCMTDTGSFRFPATTASVHLMLADLKNRGLKHSEIHSWVYDSWSAERMKFLGYVLYEKMEINYRYNYGIIPLTLSDQTKFNLSTGDTEGIVNYPFSVKGVRISVLIKETPQEIKMSFRSKGNIDISDVARKYFTGGGHFNAAGGKSDLSLQETIKLVKQILENLKYE